ncbi:rhodanese-like domain-containing protein [uncultured Chitinophaga sp.]|jgi:Rhodanese-related sulfurtransferase|uniref:rhodanese-like domain-containing protein n=1 Tax=uncultured Chitinophaga sp. TaxID=339340 RepID=UPI002626A930|nr:rhodanese-like domain-containing protein [uncultured Chitinophaga sp.]
MKFCLNVLPAVAAYLLFTSYAVAQTVNVETFDKGMHAENVQLFDVRTAQEFSSGHISGSLQADYTNPAEFAERVQYLDKQKPVYIYCLSGGRSAAAAKWMRENGFKEVVEMDGGIRAWKEAGKPLEGAAAEKQLALNDFRESVQHGLVLVDVGAAWCPPCRAMEPVLQAFLKEHPDVKLVKVDGGKDQEVMQAISAKKLPTFVFYKAGKEAWRKEGIVEKKELEAVLQ